MEKTRTAPHNRNLKRRRRLLAAVAGLLLLPIAPKARAQTVFEQNANGQAFDYPGDPNGMGNYPTDSNWSQVRKFDSAGNIIAPSNWSVPTGVASGASVVINGLSSIDDANYTISSLTLDNAGSVAINSGVTLTVSGSVTSNGGILINGNAAFHSLTNNGGTASGANGVAQFNANSTAGNCIFINNSAAASGAIGGATLFYNSSTAANEMFTNNGGAISGTVSNPTGGGITSFYNTSTAGHGTFTNNGATASGAYLGSVNFNDTSNAGNGVFTNNGGTVSGESGGYMSFSNTSAASTGAFTNKGATVSGAFGGTLVFNDTSSAGTATFTNNGGTVSGANGGNTQFNATSSADGAMLIANGGAAAGNGGGISFSGQSTGGTATVMVNGNGFLDISAITLPSLTVGSIEGSGNVFLGANNLTAGSNNLSKAFSGVIQDGGISGGTGGSLTKTGSGTLTLSGANTYTGATSISAGVLQLGNGGTTGSINSSSGVSGSAGATLVFDRGNSLVFSLPISGGIGLTQAGAGLLYLTGNNSYTGATTINSGAIVVGANGATGSLGTGNVVNKGTLYFDRSNNSVVNNVISGSGAVIQESAGYVYLTGNNTYTGATMINSGGIVVGANGATGSLGTGSVVNKGILYFDRSNIPTVSNIISGSGVVIQDGSGGVIFTGANAYTGATEILAGSLQLGSNGTTGSLGTGSVVDNGTLAFDRSNNPVVTNLISGSGAVVQNGAGYVYLTGNNTYTGATTINSGGIIVGGNGTTGALGTGTVVDNGILYFDRSNIPTVSNVISGSGAVVQNGSGGVTLTGASTYTGATMVEAGTLLVNGSNSSSATTVYSGGTLGGSGTVGVLKVVSGGTVLPGSSSAGGLLKTGNLSLASGADLSLELGGTTGGGTSATLYGEVKVTGTVTLGGAAQISLVGGFTPAVNEVFNVILNDGSDAVVGAFSNAPGNIITSGGVEYQVNYAANADGGAVANDVSLKVIAVPSADSPARLAVPRPDISLRRQFPSPTPGGGAVLLASDGETGDSFGNSVSLSGAIGLVGAPLATVYVPYQGAAYLFRNLDTAIGTVTQNVELTASDGVGEVFFGTSVSLSGAIGLVGAPTSLGSYVSLGAAYVFRNLDTATGTVTQNVKLITSDGALNDQFGASVSLSGAFGLVGAPNAQIGFNSGQGVAYVFRKLDTATGTVTQNVKLTASDGATNDSFGTSVSLSGAIATVGAPAAIIGSNSAQGAAYVFRKLDTATGTVTQNAKLTASDGAAFDSFGTSVSLSGAIGLVGAPAAAIGANFEQGAAYVFRNLDTATGTVTQNVKLIASDGAANDQFGSSVSLSGAIGLVGAPRATIGSTSGQGAAYVFRNLDTATGTFTQYVKLTASDGGPDNFGSSVSLNGDLFTIGAPFHNNATGNAYTGSVSSVTTLDAGSTALTIGGISFVSQGNWIVGQTTSSNEVTLTAGNSGDVTASGKAVYIGQNAGSNNNALIIAGCLTANQITVGAVGNTGNVLQLGNGGTTGTLSTSSVITDNGTLVFDHSNFITQGTDFGSAPITGTGSVTQLGTGTTVLNAANAYTGGTTISAGTLQFTKTTAMPATGAVTVSSGATLAVNAGGAGEFTNGTSGNGTIGGLLSGLGRQSGSTVSFASGAFLGIDTTNAPGSSLTYSGAITDSGLGLTKLGAGALIFTGANTYAGATTVDAGALQLGNGGNTGSISSSSGVSGNAGATLIFDHGNNLIFSAPISGGIGVTEAGTGNVYLTGNNSYTGATTINSGGIIVGNGSTTGSLGTGNVVNDGSLYFDRSNNQAVSNAISGSGAVVQDGVGDVYLTRNNSYTGTTTINSGGIIVGNDGSTGSLGTGNVVNDGSLYFFRSNNQAVSNVISGSGAVLQDGAGYVRLTGNNSYTGGTTINSGGIIVGNDGTTGSLGAGNVVNDGTLYFYRTNPSTMSNVISGSGAVVQDGSGGVTLTGNNTYTGVTYIRAGSLQLGNGGTTGSLGTGSVVDDGILTFDRSNNQAVGNVIGGPGTVVQDGTGNVYLTGSNSYTGGTTINSGGIIVGNGGTTGSLGTGRVVNDGSLYLFRSNDEAVRNVISGSGAVFQDGAGEAYLIGNNSYTGATTINSGGMVVGANGATGSLGTRHVVNDGSLYFFRSNNLAVSSVISGSGAVFQDGAGYVYLTGNNSYTGATRINAGGIIVGLDGATGSLGAGNVMNDGSLYFFRSNNLAVNNVISGSGAVIQDGAGGVTLARVNTYTGLTRVNSGTLLVNGSISGSTTTVNATGTLGGVGTVGALDAVNGGTVRPGSSSAGGLLKTGNFFLGSGANLSLELGGTTGGGTAATLYGEVKATGTVTLGGAAQISLAGGFTPAVNDVFNVILNDGSDAVVGRFSNAPGNIITSDGVEYQVNYAANGDGGAVANDVSLKVIAVPAAESPARLAVSGPDISLSRQSPAPAPGGAVLLASDGAAGDQFGFSVSLSGAIGLSGAPFATVGSNASHGAAYVFRNLDTATGTVTQNVKLTASDGVAYDQFGSSVSLSGAIGLVGAPNTILGASYVFRNLDTATGTVTQSVKLTASDGLGGNQFGSSVSLSGVIGLVGAPALFTLFNFPGEAYVFRNLDTATGTVTQNVKLTSSDGAADDNFGMSVSLSGAIGLVGAPQFGPPNFYIPGPGTAYVFRNLDTATGAVTQNVELVASDGLDGDAFGSSVSLSGAIGLVEGGGAAYVFRNLDTATGTVTQNAKLVASDGAGFSSVSLSGAIGLVGAPYATIGANSGQGAAYVFLNLGTATSTVMEDVKVFASDGAANDNFGTSASLNGNLFTIGASGKNSSTGKAYTGSVRSITTLDAGSTSLAIGGISFVSQDDWIIGQTTSGNQVTLNAGNSANVTASGKAVYIGQNAGSNNNTLVIAGDLTANQIKVGAVGNTGNTLQLGNGGTTGTLSSSSVITDNGTVIFDRSNNQAVSNVISGSGAVVQDGVGYVRLTGNNSYTGATTINSGGIIVGLDGTTGSLGTGNVVNDGFLYFYRTNNLTVSNVISGSGAVVQDGSGGVTLTGTNTYPSVTYIRAGSLQLGNGGTTGSLGTGSVVDDGILTFDRSNYQAVGNVIGGPGAVVQNGSGNVYLTGSNSYTGGTTINSGGIIVGNDGTTGALGTGRVVNDGSLYLYRSNDEAVRNVISGSGAVFQDGAGEAYLIGNNSYTGATTINSGGMVVGANGATGSLGTGNVLNDGSLYFFRSNNLAVSNVISGSGAVFQDGAGYVYLTGDNSYTGATRINSGGIIVGLDGATGSLGAGNVMNDGSLYFFRSNNLAVNNVISGSGAVIQDGAGGVTLAGVNTYTGVTYIRAGSLQVGNGGTTGSLGTGSVVDDGILTFDRSNNQAVGNVIGGPGTVVQDGTGNVYLTGSNSYTGGTTINSGGIIVGDGGTTGSLGTGRVVNDGSLYLFRSNNLAVSSVISGSGALFQDGAGYVYLTGDNSYTGATRINAGGIIVGLDGATGSLGAGNVMNDGSLYFFRSNNLAVNNVISGSGAVIQDGAGGVTLAGVNSYTGLTRVNSGTLVVNGSISGSTTTVNASGTLGGIGTVGALFAVNGGTVLPGSSSGGGLLKTGNFSLGSSAHLSLELGGTTGIGTAATLYGEVKVTGAVTLGGTAQISLFGGFTPAVNDIFYVILNDGSDPVSGKFSNAPGNIITSGGYEYQVNYAANGDGGAVANDVSLKVIAIPEGQSLAGFVVPEPDISLTGQAPEPGSWTLLLFGFALAAGCKRHWRTRRA